jgi:hypothetical protein
LRYILNAMLKTIAKLIIFILLTVITQIGGVLYLVSSVLIGSSAKWKFIKRTAVFIGLYLITTFYIVPVIAPYWGREKIVETEFLEAHSWCYTLANRSYVKPQLNRSLKEVSEAFGTKNPGIKLVYLDANFPFIDGFPLLPHLSHNDGKKIDIALIYKDGQSELTNKKPSRSGYGVYENPKNGEFNQTVVCKKQEYWQYDFPKYLSMGTTNDDISFSEEGTKQLIGIILKQKKVERLFIEPHLKSRLILKSDKLKFHGCKAVRHDDHIHFETK